MNDLERAKIRRDAARLVTAANQIQTAAAREETERAVAEWRASGPRPVPCDDPWSAA